MLKQINLIIKLDLHLKPQKKKIPGENVNLCLTGT